MATNSDARGIYAVVTTREAEMSAHDALPPVLRQMVHEAGEQFSCVEILTAWNRACAAVGEGAAAMLVTDQIRQVSREYRKIRDRRYKGLAGSQEPGEDKLERAVWAAERKSEERQKRETLRPGGRRASLLDA